MVGDFLAVISGNVADNDFGLRAAHGADALHGFTEAFLPDAAVGIEQDIDGTGILQGRQQQGPHVLFQFFLRTFLAVTLTQAG